MQGVRSNNLFKDDNSNVLVIASWIMGSGPNLRMVLMGFLWVYDNEKYRKDACNIDIANINV